MRVPPKLLKLPWLCWISCWAACLPAQEYVLSVQHFPEQRGSVYNDVYAVQEDERGVLWVGTQQGLRRFDGQQFKYFAAKEGLARSDIFRIFKDGRKLWLLSAATGFQSIEYIQVFDIYTERVQALPDFLGARLPFEWPALRYCTMLANCILFETAQGAWTYTAGEGFAPLPSLPAGAKVLHRTQQGGYILQTAHSDGDQLSMVDAQGRPFGKPAVFKGAGWVFHFQHEDEQGQTYWAARRELIDAEFLLLRFDAGFAPQLRRALAKPLNNISNISYLPALQAYWLASDHTGQFMDEQGNILAKAETPGIQLIGYQRQQLFKKEVLWHAGSDGLYKIQVEPALFKVLAEWPAHSGFRAMAKADGALFFACNQGLLRLDSAVGAIEQMPGPRELLSLAVDEQGQLWAANQRRIQAYNTTTEAYQLFPSPFHTPWAMLYADGEGFWVSETGWRLFNPYTQEMKAADYGAFPELGRHTVYHAHHRGQGQYWLCATSGLYEFDLPNAKLNGRYWPGGKGRYALPEMDIRHLYADANSRFVWLATGQNGLLRWQPETGQTLRLSFSSQATNTVHSLYPDSYGHLWASTDGGLVQLDTATLAYKVYTTKEGLPNDEMNRLAHFQDTVSGLIYLGGVLQLFRFDPRDFKDELRQPMHLQPIVVEWQQYLGQQNRLENLTAKFFDSERMELRPDDRFCTITVSLEDLNWAEGAVYQYRLAGKAETWTAAPDNRITLGRLPYGRQVLLLRAQLANGQYSEQMAIPLLVARPFYFTWWFALAAIALVGGLVYWRVQDLQQQNIRLEQEVDQRTEKIAHDKALIEQQAAELRQLDELKSRFFANVSHELRTPLTLILGPAANIKQLAAPNSKLHTLAQLVERNGSRLLQLVNTILDLNKLDSQALEAQARPLALAPFLRQRLALFEGEAQRGKRALDLETNWDEQTAALLDADKLATILDNLLSNALKFTPAGGQVRLKAWQQAEHLFFAVTDTGRGIAQVDLPHVFERFYQSKHNTVAEGGTGIGLSFSYELASIMGGALSVDSVYGKGSTFTLRLPFLPALAPKAPKTAASPEAAAPAPLPAQSTAEADRPQLLIVEDNPDLQDYLGQLLAADYQLAYAANGQEALRFLSHQPTPDLILSDIMMPVMDGYALLSTLKSDESFSQIPVIMLTARAGREDKLQALRIGVDDYLTKPFVAEELMARIANLLRHAKVRQAPLEQEEEAEYSAEQNPGPTQVWLEALEQLVKDKLGSHDFSVDFLASQLQMSRPTLNAKLKKAVGMTALHYIREVRLCAARDLLEAHPDMTVKEVVEKIGMSDAKYFARQYKARFGRLPSER